MTTPQRIDPPFAADEAAMLGSFLDFQRETLAGKYAGLTDAQVRERSVPPSSLSLLGLVRHMTEVERFWFRHIIDGEDLGRQGLYWSEEDPDGDFDGVDGADPAADFALWRSEVDRSRAISVGVPLESVGRNRRRGDEVTHRWVLVHMINEYARHNGHADFLRERIDGSTGE